MVVTVAGEEEVEKLKRGGTEEHLQGETDESWR